jgi:hypothetical protein
MEFEYIIFAPLIEIRLGLTGEAALLELERDN